ncbi:hypothetical protein ACHAWT_003856 [Skeletonema menzelii]
MDRDEFMSRAASGLLDMQSLMASIVQHDQANGMAPGEGMLASMMAPKNVTPSVKAQIAALPLVDHLIVYLHIDEEFEDEGSMLMCQAHIIEKEHGSDGKPYADSDGFGMALAHANMLGSTLNDKIRLLLGTLAQACLEPMGGNLSALAMFPVEMRSRMQNLYPPARPAKVLVQTRGYVEMLRDDLQEMGISNVDVAEQNIIQSCELFASSQNTARDGRHNLADNVENMGDPRAMATHLMNLAEGPYVSEEHESLRGWNPPNEPGDFPRHWYAQPPKDPNSYRPTTLCGWRTNLERAVLGQDREVVERITSQYSASDVREYVECRMLLTKAAMRGMVNACKLLIDECGASVEGAQAPDAKRWWKDIQNQSGNYHDMTPLHQAAQNGKVATLRLLLDYGANINQIDRTELRASALQHAVSKGEIDCVQLLCERGADHTHMSLGGSEALDVSEMMAQSDVGKKRVQEKVQQILREYDPRCSYCREPNPQKRCPCKKERYCDATCQKNRWKLHKKYHRHLTTSPTTI